MDRLPEIGGKDPLADASAIASRRQMLDECKRKLVDMLKQTIRPEFLNRIDEIIMFDPLTRADIREILHIQAEALRKKLSEDGVEMEFTPAFEDYMVDKGYDPAFGARPVKRVMQRDLVNLLAKSMLDGTVHKNSKVIADVRGGQIFLREE